MKQAINNLIQYVLYLGLLLVPFSSTGILFDKKSDPKPFDFAHALMEEKFIFLYSVLPHKEKHIEDVNTVFQRSEKEILFMEKLTGIESSYPHDHHLGKFFIYERDFIEWTVWYFKNKPFVVWDEAQQQIVFQKPKD